MIDFLSTPFSIGNISFRSRLIQGPLAGYSCAPFRQLFHLYHPPAYSVSEMMSAQDVLTKHTATSRYLYRDPRETTLAYQISGSNPETLARAAKKLEAHGADIIDINCGCPKNKIRKKGAGSALLNTPETLKQIIEAVRMAVHIPITVKIRISESEYDVSLANVIENAGADAIIVHGRQWNEGYDTPSNLQHINSIKKNTSIPIIANGDISCKKTLKAAVEHSACDAFMISRGGCGHPWLYQQLLSPTKKYSPIQIDEKIQLFMMHLTGLEQLETEKKAVLQSKSLVRYYFKDVITPESLQVFYSLDNLLAIKHFLDNFF